VEELPKRKQSWKHGGEWRASDRAQMQKLAVFVVFAVQLSGTHETINDPGRKVLKLKGKKCSCEA
jgi:hypothetical protein